MVRRVWSGGLACAAAVLTACGGGGGDAPQSCIVVAPTQAAGPLFVPAEPPVPLVQVSGASPFAPGCGLETGCGTVYVGAEVEPFLAANPQDPQNLVGVWQQDRWSNGSAQGLLAAFSRDGGRTWSWRQAPFTRCSGGNAANGGDYARATDPWISFGPDGTAHWMAMAVTDLPDGREVSAMRVSRSTDGGDTWSAPVTLIEDVNPYFNDKNTITADPTDARYVYAVWDRLDYAGNTGPAYFSRTTDGGLTWSTAVPLYDPGPDAQTIGNRIVVLSDGTLLNLLTLIHYGTPTTPDFAQLRVSRSTNQGASWVAAYATIAPLQARGAYDPESGQAIRDGSILGQIAVGPDDTVWVAWQDATVGRACIDPPCYGPTDGIALASSADGGLNWSEPVLVNGDLSVQAFTPAVHVAADGTLGVSYYDLRDNTADPSLLASHWLATSADGGATWTEQLISGPFDVAIAPDARGLFLGDYAGLASVGGDFLPFFAQTTGDLADRTNIVVRPLPGGAVAAKSAPRARTYAAAAGPRLAPDAALAREIGENIRRQRAQQFPDTIRPDIPAQLLR